MTTSFYSDSELRELGLGDFGERVRLSRKSSVYAPEHIHLGSDVRIDDFCVLAAGEGGIATGDFVHIAVQCSLIGGGRISLADFSGLSSRVSIYSSSDDYSGEALTNPTVPDAYKRVMCANVHLGKHVVVGSGSVILPGAYLEDGVAVGALSLVKGRCESFGVYAGQPARRIRERSQELLAQEARLLKDTRTDLEPR